MPPSTHNGFYAVASHDSGLATASTEGGVTVAVPSDPAETGHAPDSPEKESC